MKQATCQRRATLPEDDARDDGIATGPMCGKPATCRVCDPVGAYACDEHKCRCRLPLFRTGTITADEVVTSEVRPLQARIRELEAEAAAEWRHKNGALPGESDAVRRAEAAEKRVGELEQQLRAVREGADELRAKLRATPTAAVSAEAGERRVFDGEAVSRFTETDRFWTLVRPPQGRLAGALSDDSNWLGGLEGKRVRLTVEVLPDPKEKP